MTQEQLATRQRRGDEEVFVITTDGAGWNVRSALNPKNTYRVADDGGELGCSCPDYRANVTEDPTWKCKHILAVERQQPDGNDGPAEAGYEPQERAAIQSNEPVPLPVTGQPLNRMLIKRSLSPDGRIDSISIEFSFEEAHSTAAQLKSQALRALRLQTEIVREFLGGGNGRVRTPAAVAQNGNGVASARVVDVGTMNGRYGERYFLNVDVNGRRARLFGSAAQIASVIVELGGDVVPDELEAGMRLNLPCRALTEPSRDGKYLNVTKVLPLNPVRSQGNGRARY